jgi:hypothetical protein
LDLAQKDSRVLGGCWFLEVEQAGNGALNDGLLIGPIDWINAPALLEEARIKNAVTKEIIGGSIHNK